VQHTFGVPVDLGAALTLARRYQLELIEDCVHSLGATYGGRLVGSFGRAAFFSTEETKTISSTMGGMLVTDDADLAGRVAAIQQRCAWPPAGLASRYVLKLVLYQLLTHPRLHGSLRAMYERLGERHPLPRPLAREEHRGQMPANYLQRLSNAQAALALRQLRRLGENLAHRRRVASTIERRLVERRDPVPQVPADAVPAYVRYPIWVENRAAALAATRQDLVLGTWFTSVLQDAESPAAGDYLAGSCPRAEAAARHLINLPTHPRITPQDAERVLARLALPPSARPLLRPGQMPSASA
jgi:dTDP-4-amino-4,6-dideoxygalactose transaminase